MALQWRCKSSKEASHRKIGVGVIHFQKKGTTYSKKKKQQEGRGDSGGMKEKDKVRKLIMAQMIQVLLASGKHLRFYLERSGDQSLEACE